MPAKRPTTIAAYIKAAPREAQPHLRALQRILKSVAPRATQTIKWGAPFFIEPRFLFSFSAFKSYCVFVPGAATLAAFRAELKSHPTTKNFLKASVRQAIAEGPHSPARRAPAASGEQA